MDALKYTQKMFDIKIERVKDEIARNNTIQLKKNLTDMVSDMSKVDGISWYKSKKFAAYANYSSPPYFILEFSKMPQGYFDVNGGYDSHDSLEKDLYCEYKGYCNVHVRPYVDIKIRKVKKLVNPSEIDMMFMLNVRVFDNKMKISFPNYSDTKPWLRITKDDYEMDNHIGRGFVNNMVENWKKIYKTPEIDRGSYKKIIDQISENKIPYLGDIVDTFLPFMESLDGVEGILPGPTRLRDISSGASIIALSNKQKLIDALDSSIRRSTIPIQIRA